MRRKVWKRLGGGRKKKGRRKRKKLAVAVEIPDDRWRAGGRRHFFL